MFLFGFVCFVLFFNQKSSAAGDKTLHSSGNMYRWAWIGMYVVGLFANVDVVWFALVVDWLVNVRIEKEISSVICTIFFCRWWFHSVSVTVQFRFSSHSAYFSFLMTIFICSHALAIIWWIAFGINIFTVFVLLWAGFCFCSGLISVSFCFFLFNLYIKFLFATWCEVLLGA